MSFERSLQRSALKYLKLCPETEVRVNTALGNAAHHVGDPDLYGCVRGLMFLIELKQEGGRTSAAQEHAIRQWKEAGARVFVCRSMDEVRAAWSAMAHASGVLIKVDMAPRPCPRPEAHAALP